MIRLHDLHIRLDRRAKGIVITGAISATTFAPRMRFTASLFDVVFQGASVAFDLSMEEIWIPYLVGATLFVATHGNSRRDGATPRHSGGGESLRAGPRCRRFSPCCRATLRRCARSSWRRSLPTGHRRTLDRIGRTIYNSYGPTEATVVATVSEVWPREPVTIGKPIPITPAMS